MNPIKVMLLALICELACMMFAYFAWKQSRASQNLTFVAGAVTWACGLMLWSHVLGMALALVIGVALIALMLWFYSQSTGQQKAHQ